MPRSSSNPRNRRDEDALKASYDRVPYPAYAQHQTHPDLLATLGVLHGLEPAPPARCRVLELGCADGGNLLPMACRLPSSRFVGVDLSPLQIEHGRRAVRALGLDNLELKASSLLGVDAGYGRFDYVIAHGVYSWIPAEAQDKLLAVCRENLAPHGVAYVSYNTYPGWYQRRVARDMMLYHSRGEGDPERRTEQAVAWIEQLCEALGETEDTYAASLRACREHLEDYRDRMGYIFHEYLEAENAPLYFHQFIDRAGRHGLQYLAEADHERSELGNLAPAVAGRLEAVAKDRLELEQYIDFATNRAFRRTLLCHREHKVERSFVAERVQRLFAASAVEPVSSEPVAGSSISFRTLKGSTFSTSHELAKAVFVILGEAWPEALAFEELLRAVGRRLGAGGADAGVLADFLYSTFYSGVIELWSSAPTASREMGERPRVSAVARWQAATGRLITNQRHQMIHLDDPMGRWLLTHLDGRHDRDGLTELVEQEARAGRLELKLDDQAVDPDTRLERVIGQLIEHHLAKTARYALLEG